MTASLITVRDVWRGSLPAQTSLVAGAEGLDRRVEWATTLRTRPPAFDAIKGGEIAFVPVKSIRLLDDRLDLAQVVSSLADKGGVAVAVLGDVDATSTGLADRLALPLLKLPDSVHVGDIQQAAVRFILEQRTLLHEAEQSLHRQLTELALVGAGPAAIIDELARIVGMTAAWQAPDGTCRHVSPEAGSSVAMQLDSAMDAVTAWASRVVLTAADPPVREFGVEPSGMSKLVAPIPVRESIGGYVSVLGPEDGLTQLARRAAARAASACAIELDRERAVLKAKDDLEGEFVESLITATYSSEEAVLERARRLGFAIEGTVSVLVGMVHGDPPAGFEDHALLAAKGWGQRRAPDALVVIHRSAICALLPVMDQPPEAPVRLARDLRLECAEATGRPDLSVGVGRPHTGPPGIRASFREAEQALTVGWRLYGGGRVLDFADLGLYRLLFAMSQHAELAEFHADHVGTLVEYDERTGGALMKTLDAYFQCHGSPTEMAARLHLHRNTVLYRLGRIEEIGRLQLDDPSTRLNLHLCLRAGEVLQSTARA